MWPLTNIGYVSTAMTNEHICMAANSNMYRGMFFPRTIREMSERTIA